MCFLIKNHYGNYQTIVAIPFHILMAHYKWFINDENTRIKAKRDYDLALAKISNPFISRKKGGRK